MPTIQVATAQKILVRLIEAKILRSDQVEHCRNYLKQHPDCSKELFCQFLLNEEMITPFQHKHISAENFHNLIFSHYILEDVIGKGSLGFVYRAKRVTTGQKYAIKLVSERNKGNISKFSEKLHEFSRFRSRTIVPIVHIFAHQGKIGLVWSYIEKNQFGSTLENLVKEKGKLTPKESVRIALQLIKALRVVHNDNLFHGTLKPSNIIVTSKLAARMLDFGIGFLMSVGRQESLLDTMTNASQIASHLDCSSPETINDATVRTPAADRYSLGCILYYSLTGQYPFPEENTVKKMLAHQFEAPQNIQEVNPSIPTPLANIVHQLIEKQPEDRFESTDELEERLEAILNPVQPQARPAPKPAPKPIVPSTQLRNTPPTGTAVPRHQPSPQSEQAPQPAKTSSNGLVSTLIWLGVLAIGFAAGMLAYSLF